MDKLLHKLHIKAGYAAGREKICNNRVNYKTEQAALKAAREKLDHEEYPCIWCHGWHIGRKKNKEIIKVFLNISIPKSRQGPQWQE